MKNRKNKLRNLSVNGVNYKWLFDSRSMPYHERDYVDVYLHKGMIKIWEGKEVILEEEYESENPVSSSYIMEAIRSITGSY